MDKSFILIIDVSDLAVGAVLQQDYGAGLQSVVYFLKKLKGAELNWMIFEKETLVQVLAVKNWRCFLEGVDFIM